MYTIEYPIFQIEKKEFLENFLGRKLLNKILSTKIKKNHNNHNRKKKL